MQPELETLEIRLKSESAEVALLAYLAGPYAMDDQRDHDTALPRQESHVCPKLKELKLQYFISGEDRRRSEVTRRCCKFLRWRMEKGCPLQRCLLEWPDGTIDELIGLPYLDMPGAGFTSLCDIFTSWEICNIYLDLLQ